MTCRWVVGDVWMAAVDMQVISGWLAGDLLCLTKRWWFGKDSTNLSGQGSVEQTTIIFKKVIYTIVVFLSFCKSHSILIKTHLFALRFSFPLLATLFGVPNCPSVLDWSSVCVITITPTWRSLPKFAKWISSWQGLHGQFMRATIRHTIYYL